MDSHRRLARLLFFGLAAAAFASCAGGSTGSGDEGATGGISGGGANPGPGSGGNSSTGGTPGTGGVKGTGGTAGAKGGSGGSTGTGGTSTSGAVDCTAALPTSGGTMHTGSTQGMAGSQSWSIWMNGSGGSITTYSTPAFSASWGPNSGDFLARIGLQWGNGKAYTSLGTVSADFSETKSGNAGTYSYVGIYGWSVNPCIEWYIVDDAYNGLPFNPGGTVVNTATIDGAKYNLITRSTTGTGGNRCGNVTSWNQFYSIRTSTRTCGTISITDHWNAWASNNMQLGAVLEASILIEAGGGMGSIQFPVANVTAK